LLVYSDLGLVLSMRELSGNRFCDLGHPWRQTIVWFVEPASRLSLFRRWE
jgi:hypothetical protein